MKGLKDCNIPVFLYDVKEHKRGSGEWEIKRGSKEYSSNIQEAHACFNQAENNFKAKDYENAFNNAKAAFEKDERNIDACLMTLDILLNKKTKTKVSDKEVDSLMNKIKDSLLDGKDRYSYFSENIFNSKVFDMKNDKIKLLDAKFLQSELTKKLNEIRIGIIEIDKWVGGSIKEKGKSQKDYAEKRLLDEIVDELSDSDTSGRPRDKFLGFLFHPIIIKLLNGIALSHITKGLNESDKNEELQENIRSFQNILFLEFCMQKTDFNKFKIDTKETRRLLKKIIESSDFWKAEQRQKGEAETNYDYITGET